MLQIIMGRSGSGKTEYINNLLCSLAAKEKEKLMVIVPEQLSFETEKTFLDLLGPNKSKKIEVLTFNRIVDFIFRQVGGFSGRAIDDGGRSVLMSLAIENASEELELYKKQAHTPDFTQLMLTAVKEFKMCAISTEMILKASQKAETATLKQKLKETAIITQIYNALLEKSYVDPLDNISKMYNVLLENDIFNSYTVAIDSFSGFTAAEQLVLGQIMKQCENCYITLCTDQAEYIQKSTRFSTTNNTKRVVQNLAKKNGVGVKEPIFLTENHRAKTTTLKAVEKQVFNPQKNPVENCDDSIYLYMAKDIYSECSFVASEIRRLVMNEHYRYKDIAIVCRRDDSYQGVLDTALDSFNVSYFMDKPQDIDSKPLITFVISAFDTVHSGFSTDSIMLFLKTGFALCSKEDISLLENYAYIWSITGKQWLEPFTANPKGYANEISEEDVRLLKKLEGLRSVIITNIKEFKNNIYSGNGRQISLAVYKLLERFSVEKQIKTKAINYIKEEKTEESKEEIRIWDIFISALDQIAMLLNDTSVNSKRYCELLKTVVLGQNIAFIPRGQDQVTIGTADRVRLNKPKVTFLVGANEGEFPSIPVTAGIFNDDERKFLLSLDLPLYDTLEELSATEQFYAYTVLSSPSEKLFVTNYDFSLNGEVKYPSSILNEIKAIIPNVKIRTQQKENPYVNIYSKKQAFDVLTANWNLENVDNQKLYDYFINDENYKQLLHSVENQLNKEPAQIKNKELSKKLFKEQMHLSASQVEKFYLCSFQYFCMYGLKVRERKKAQIDSAEYGSLIHYLLEQLLKNYTVEQLSTFTDDELYKIIKQQMNEYLQTYLGGEENKNSRFIISYHRIKDTAVMLVKHIVKELSQSEFRPVDFELKIGEDIAPYILDLGDSKKVIIEGYVDRVDIYKNNNTAHIRIVDYKTGLKKFAVTDVTFGLNLQMLLYLSTIIRNGKERYNTQLSPAGVLYMPSGEAYIKVDNDENIGEQQSLRDKKYCMNGLLVDDIEIIEAMEKGGNGVYIPVKLKEEKPKKKKEQEYTPQIVIGSGKEYTVSPYQMQRIFDKIDMLITQMATNLLDGKISAVPAKGSGYDACKYCPYSKVCGYKEGMPCKEINKAIKPYETFNTESEVQ